MEVFGAQSLPEALCLAHSVTPGVMGEDVPLRPLWEKVRVHALLLGARLGIGSCSGQSQVAPGAGGERWAAEGSSWGRRLGRQVRCCRAVQVPGPDPPRPTPGRQRHKQARAEGPLRAPDGNPGPGHPHPGTASPEQTLHQATPASLHQSFPGVVCGGGAHRAARASGLGEGGAQGDSRPSVSLCSPSPIRCAPPKASSLTCCEFSLDFQADKCDEIAGTHLGQGCGRVWAAGRATLRSRGLQSPGWAPRGGRGSTALTSAWGPPAF